VGVTAALAIAAVVVVLTGLACGSGSGTAKVSAGRPARAGAAAGERVGSGGPAADAGVNGEARQEQAQEQAGPAPDDLAALSALLAKGELKGWIHGAVHERGLYVFTYRKPHEFFAFAEFPLAPATDAVAAALLQVKRHDAVQIRGSFIDNDSPIPHIRLDSVVVRKAYTTDENPPRRPYQTAIPADLEHRTEAIAKVHAIADDGAMLVIEYGDAVVPVYVGVPALTAGLYRNDKIRIAFEVASAPARPVHLWLDTAAPRPVEVLERLRDHDGKPFVATGALVRFPKSEQIITDIYAVQVSDSDHVTREYTLVNSDRAVFAAISAKLAAAWRSRPGGGIDGRNKLVNPKIRVRAEGIFSITDPNQANAQILIASPDQVTITFD
jgi:hypothetical protein